MRFRIKSQKRKYLPVFVGDNFVCIRGMRFFGDPYAIGKQVGYLLCKPIYTCWRGPGGCDHNDEMTLWREVVGVLDWGNCGIAGISSELFIAGAKAAWNQLLRRQTRTIFVKKGKG